MIDTPSIIFENQKRIEKLFAPYDPLKGIGGPLKREKLVLDELGEYYLPVEFFNQPIGQWFSKLGSLNKFVEKFPETGTIDLAYDLFINERIKYDFEFWTAISIIIQDKISMQEFPFILRRAQQKFLKIIFDLLWTGVPVNIILVKARQWGGSTLVQFVMRWVQRFHRKNWHMAICAQDDGAASNIREMIVRAEETYPEHLGKSLFKPYAHSSKNIIDTVSGGIVAVGSVQNPKQFRSYNYTMIHNSEVCEWEETKKRSAKQVVTALRSSLSGQPFTFDVLESTAKGIGNFFHNEYQDAVNKKSNYTPVFVGCHEIDMYQKKIELSYEDFILSIRDDLWYLWELGATLECINWYQQTMRDKNYDTWQMKQEYPATADEAFQGSGHPVFRLQDLLILEKTCCDPIIVGDIHSSSRSGKTAFDNISIEPNPNGYVSVWSLPEPIVEIDGKKYHVANRYCGFADIGGRNPLADFSELCIVDKYMMLPEFAVYGGIPEIALQWHGHLDQDLFAWQCAIISWWYDKALLAIEDNVLDRMETEGNHFLTVLDTIGQFYPNLFTRESIDKITNTIETRYGWHETRQSKVQTVDFLNALIRDREYVERDRRAINQMKMFEHKTDGTMGAVLGEKDDMVTTRKGALWIAIKGSPQPRLVLLEENKREVKSKMGMANF